VYISAQIKAFSPVLVSSQPLPRGTTLSNQNTLLMERDLSKLPQGHYLDQDALTGYTLKRAISRHTPLTPMMLKPPLLVLKGDEVSIVSGNQNFSVKGVGIALQDGKLGQQIEVKNSRSGRVVRARVTATGVVTAGN
jgi:flagella basal body P-ring formation protein FlgA